MLFLALNSLLYVTMIWETIGLPYMGGEKVKLDPHSWLIFILS